ncbi:Chromate resistance protein ChrB [Glutamicibacter uratoxydans]|uniref:Chromate resistance protein ChrB n=1 Tax=Glutamicibacter uratoxydans TaxID=43667 RepID=UPI001C3F6D16|nr:Chromate resistance protein ChrB [Glutamicibacter uratoxydans]
MNVTAVTLVIVTNEINWLLLLVQVPSEPSRHRVAVWRQLRKTGAVPVISGAWALPNAPQFSEGIAKAKELCRSAGGTFAVLNVEGEDEQSQSVLETAFRDARSDEWKEFLADCLKFEAEIAKEISIEKFTFAELEEEEQSLERLRRWFRDLKKRDALQLPAAEQAQKALNSCIDSLEAYAQSVYSAQNGGE